MPPRDGIASAPGNVHNAWADTAHGLISATTNT